MKTKRRNIFIVLIVFGVLISFVLASLLELQTEQKDAFKRNTIPEREQIAITFLTDKMSGKELSVYTNYLNSKNDDPDIPAGHEILSESQGLLLLYFLNRNEKESFDICLDWTVDHLLLDNGIFSWLDRAGKAEHTNALIDDLRLNRALLLAYEKWHDERYLQYSNSVSEALLNYNTVEGMPIDFYQLDNHCKSKEVSIAYLDLYTMKKLRDKIDPRWKIPYDHSLVLIKKAKLKGTGLYRYQYDTEAIEYKEYDDISLIQSAYVILHLAEAGEYDREGLDWFWNEFEKSGKLYATYSSKNFEPVSEIESTALYALMARAYYLTGDLEKAEAFMKACEQYQIMDQNSELYGSFGNESNKEVYSFDNLQYILSSSVIYE